ncbi:DDE_3 domain-containing protein [Trichonephila clavipes]|nr:DDE_3 domain-containing protein [Trichonephila clavipes]
MVSHGQFSSNIMLVVIQQELSPRLPTSFFDSAMASSLPDLFPVEHVLDQLKRQMPTCHSVNDLELAVQDFWAHLPQDNKVSYQLNAGPCGGMYCSWRWSNALWKLPSICVVAHLVFV